jgi:hypothetical protein
MATPSSVKTYGRKRGSRCFWEPVTICDRFIFVGFVAGELEHKILGEPDDIALDGLVKGFGRRMVDLRQVAIEHDLLAANKVDSTLNELRGHDELGGGSLFGHLNH